MYIYLLASCHILFQITACSSDVLILILDFFKQILGPVSGIFLGVAWNFEHVDFRLISFFSQFKLNISNVLQILVFDWFLLNRDLHFSEFIFHTLKSIPEILFLDILSFEFIQKNGWLFHSIRNIFILIYSHSNSLILQIQWILICLFSLR